MATELLTHLNKLHSAQRAVEKHKDAFIKSLEKPLRNLGYRLERIVVAFDDAAVSPAFLDTVTFNASTVTESPHTLKQVSGDEYVKVTAPPGTPVGKWPTVTIPLREPPSPPRQNRQHQFVCPDCDRTFALPVHLGRHRQAAHGK